MMKMIMKGLTETPPILSSIAQELIHSPTHLIHRPNGRHAVISIVNTL